jgi:hypothetical protein
MNKSSQQWPLSKPLEFLQKVKYGGAVGKQAAVVIVALLVLGIALICNWGQIAAVYVVVPCVIAILAIGLISVQRTLDKHPNVAIMEGAEYVEFHRLELAAKNIPVLPETPLIADPASAVKQIEPPVIDEGEDQ